MGFKKSMKVIHCLALDICIVRVKFERTNRYRHYIFSFGSHQFDTRNHIQITDLNNSLEKRARYKRAL